MSFQDTELFKAMELNNNEEYIGDYWSMKAQFNMLFNVIHSYNVNHQNQLLDYYNNFRVEISYPKHIKIEGKFIIGKTDRGEYEIDTNRREMTFDDDFLQIDREQVKSNVIVVMMDLLSCEPLYFFDDFLQANEMLENDEMLLNAKYWRIPPKPRKSCKEFDIPVKPRGKLKKITMIAGTRKKKRIMRIKRKKRNKRTRRTKLR